MKKFFSLSTFILIACLLFNQITYAEKVSPKITIFVDGKSIKSDIRPLIVNKIVYMPIRVIFESLGYSVEADSQYKLIRVVNSKNIIVIQTNARKAKVNGKLTQISAMPISVKGSYFVPLDFINANSGAKVVWNADTFTVDITKKDSAVSYDIDVSVEQKEAERFVKSFSKTPDELLKLYKDAGNWQTVILRIVSTEKENDRNIAEKFKTYFGYTEETFFKMKYMIGNWIDVFGYLITEKEDHDDSDFYLTMDEMESKYSEKFMDRVFGMQIANSLAPLCGMSLSELFKLVGSRNRDSWQNALKNVKMKIDFLEAAKCIGMPESIIKSEKETKKLYDYEIYFSARYTWVHGGIYKDENTGITTTFTSHPRKVIDLHNAENIDPIDALVKSEFNITDDMIKRCNKCGIWDIVSIAKLSVFGIKDEIDVSNFKNLTEKYAITIDELNEFWLKYISWEQVENKIKEICSKKK